MHEYKPVSASMFHQVFERWCNVSRHLYLGSCISVSSWHNICSKVPYSLLSRSCLSARQLNFVPEVCCQCRACVHLSVISFLEIYISELKAQTVKINFSIGKIPWLNFERYVTSYSMGGTMANGGAKTCERLGLVFTARPRTPSTFFASPFCRPPFYSLTGQHILVFWNWIENS